MSALRKPDTLPQTDDDWQLMLSATLDGETAHAETDACIGALKHDEGLRQNWSEYHLIGDLMRGELGVSWKAKYLRTSVPNAEVNSPGMGKPIEWATGASQR
jgi:hypothetical protein